jgi:hypothetical protein
MFSTNSQDLSRSERVWETFPTKIQQNSGGIVNLYKLLRSRTTELGSFLLDLPSPPKDGASPAVGTSGTSPSSGSSSGDSAFPGSHPQHRIISSKYMTRVKIRPIQLVQEELAAAIREYEALNAEFVSKRDNLLAIETDVRDELIRRYDPLLREASKQRLRLQTELDLRQLNTLYPVIDLEFLRQLKDGRHGLKLPKYAVFDAANSTLQVRGQAYEPGRQFASPFHPYVTPDVAKRFLDFSQLEKFGTDYILKYKEEKMFVVTVAVAAQFTHILPDEVRQFFKDDSTKFDEVFFVTEAPDWIATLTQKGLPMSVPNRKISVIARKDQTCWLIAETEAR